MAGSYPDVPGYKFAYDVDGTVVVCHNVWNGTNFNFSSGQLRDFNNEWTHIKYSNNNSNHFGYIAFLFPEQRSLAGMFINMQKMGVVEYSTDSTTGLDGTWSTVTGPVLYNTADKIQARVNISSAVVASMTSVRIQYNGGSGNLDIRNIHLYGSTTPTASPNRLRVVDMTNTSTTSDGVTTTGEDMAAQLDFGNIPQRSNSTKQFKVVNNSSTQTATNITVSLDAPTDASPSLIGQLQVSTDNIAYANAVNIGNLAPGASSGTLYIKNTIANNAQLSVWSARIIAHAVSWS